MARLESIIGRWNDRPALPGGPRVSRGPFGFSGDYENEKLGFHIGWRWQKDAESRVMPIWNETGDIGLVLVGEEFSEGPMVDPQDGKSHKLDPDDLKYLVHLYEELGDRFFETMNGWFSGVLVDLREDKVVLFNDRYGLQRVYFHENESGLYFASEAKALLSALPELRRIDPVGWAESVSCGCVLQDRTMFAGIRLLPGGSRWTFRRGRRVEKECYFRRESWETLPLLDEESFYQKLKETFARILPKYLRNGQPMAMSLTGGIDGRMIMAWARCAPHSLPCYTFGGTYRDCADVRLARKVARACGQDHWVIPVGGELFGQFPELAEEAVCISDGTMDITGAAELYVNRIAREIAPVRLTGNYGSEILRGNVAFGPQPAREGLFDAEFERLIGEAAGVYNEEDRCHPVSFIAFKQVPWHHQARLSIERAALTPRSPFLDNELVSLMFQAPRHLVTSTGPSFRLIAEGNDALSRIPTDRGLRLHPVPVVTRLHHIMQEFLSRAEYAWDYGMPDWLARTDRVLAPLHLDRLFLGHQKFCHFRTWYRHQLADYVKDMILDARTRGRPYLRGNRLESLVKRHLDGTGNFTSEIHRIITLELIQRKLIEAN